MKKFHISLFYQGKLIVRSEILFPDVHAELDYLDQIVSKNTTQSHALSWMRLELETILFATPAGKGELDKAPKDRFWANHTLEDHMKHHLDLVVMACIRSAIRDSIYSAYFGFDYYGPIAPRVETKIYENHLSGFRIDCTIENKLVAPLYAN